MDPIGFVFFYLTAPTENPSEKKKTKAFGKGLQQNSSLNLHGLPLQIGPTERDPRWAPVGEMNGHLKMAENEWVSLKLSPCGTGGSFKSREL